MVELIRSIPGSVLSEAVQIREELHRHPELSFQEVRTAGLVASKLREFGVEVVREGMAGTGVVGLLRGGRPGRTVALRAEMDALPIEERTGLPYASQNPGVMHACGHDGHVAIVLATARMLAERRDALNGNVKFLFQPGEEMGAGAQRMVAAGVLNDPPAIQAIWGLHGRPQIRPGQIELDPMPSAYSDSFTLRVQGKGCHAGYPHLGTDPIAIGCQIVGALQLVVSRQTAPFRAVVVSIGTFHAGSRANVIPSEAELTGSIRTRDPGIRTQVIESVRRICEQTARGLGGRAELELGSGYPRVVNAPALMGLAREVGTGLLGEANVLDPVEHTMGGEDFGFYLEEQGGVPGCLLRVGVETDDFVHTDTFDFGRAGLETGILMMLNLAIRTLSGDNP